jgi:hypothetical protein
VAGLLVGLRIGRRGGWYGWVLALATTPLFVVAGVLDENAAIPLFASGMGLVLLGLVVQPRRDRLALLLIAAGVFVVLAGTAVSRTS